MTGAKITNFITKIKRPVLQKYTGIYSGNIICMIIKSQIAYAK